jgi:hypothetical protein
MFEPKVFKCVVKLNFTNFIIFFFFNHQYYDPQTSLIMRRQFGAHLIREFMDVWRKRNVHLNVLNDLSLLKRQQFASHSKHWNSTSNGNFFIKKLVQSKLLCFLYDFQRYRIVVLSHVHPLRWLLRLWKFLKSLFEYNDEGWNIINDCNCHESNLFNHFIEF